MRALVSRIVAGLLVVPALAACNPNHPVVGEVVVRLARGFVVPELQIGSDRWLSSDVERFATKENGAPTVLRRPPGAHRLQFERDGRLLTACQFEVRRDRVITITLRPVGRELRCDIVE